MVNKAFYRFIHSFPFTLQLCTALRIFITHKILYGAALLMLVFISKQAGAQRDISQRLRGLSGGMQNSSGGKDSLQHRDPNEDSITISYRYYDSSRVNKLDSSVSDFYTRFPVPYYYIDLGNNGTAARSFIFNPDMKPGFDAGFHSYDIYRYTIDGTKFYTSTRPYTELAYLLGSNSEQVIGLLHTQTRKQGRFNFTFDYRLINSPGAFKNQNTAHSGLRVSGSYQTENKRYGLSFIYIKNRLKSSENGGLQNPDDLKNLSLGDPFGAYTRLGTALSDQGRNPFSTNVAIGTNYDEGTFLLRHFYDFGQKDSLQVNDSTMVRLFYTRLRFQHTLTYSTNEYKYNDLALDSLDYATYFNYHPRGDSILFSDKWNDLTNEFSIYTYPDKKNTAQFLKVGAALQLLQGTFSNDSANTGPTHYNNTYLVGEYRNRTKNKKWDLEAAGRLYVTGGSSGDYSAYISLQRELSKKVGSLQVGFQNVNKSPTYVSEGFGSFPVRPKENLNKTNISRLFAAVYLPALQLHLTGNYYAVTNYIYYDSFQTSNQYSGLFNVLDIGLDKRFRLAKHLAWYTDVHFQQAPGNPPVHLPAIFMRNRFAFEGNFFKNLDLSTGIEIRYYTPYKADNYSPLTGQFFYQNDITINNRPDVNAYLNFRIKSFKGFVRAENLNTLDRNGKSVGFTHYNFVAPNYPQNAFWLRFGVWWSFVN
ncbi:hypothetical protein FC093_09805 [Ilyomonas limi]|uniref:Porin n=1 Tax=Ilyomonas limi TaxID=2575867 RepID=A0A4U3L5K0_9BACT|nr:putative porin [Ilyomonas limi]TKK68976.1 hypothetical protein FC093_09805 [Ilyomonas limi]